MSRSYRRTDIRPRVESLEDRIVLFQNVLNLTPVHEAITSFSLPFLKDRIDNIINVQHPLEDVLGVALPIFDEDHFTGSRFAASINKVNSRYDDILSNANPDSNAPDAFSTDLIAARFGQILHAVQDFYSHTNWIEYGLTSLFDNSLEKWVPRGPYTVVGDGTVMLVEGEDETPEVSPFGEATLSRTGSNVTVSFSNGVTFRGLVSGYYDLFGVNLGDNSPDNIAISHSEINKDSPGSTGFVPAIRLAAEQTRHEFIRLVNLIRTRHGEAGVQKLLCEWVKPEELGNVNLMVGGSAGVAVVPVIDRSGSMGDNGKLEAAQQAANVLVSLLDDRGQLGVVDFDDVASSTFPLSTIASGSGVRQQAQQAINGLTPGGSTSIGAGIQLADSFLGSASTPSQAMIVLSDGMENSSPRALDVINSQVDPCVRIFTIAFGSDADVGLLQEIARLRNGQFYFAASNADLQDIYVRLSGSLADEQDIFRTRGTISQGELRSQSFLVDPSARQLTVGLQWPGSDLDLALIAPDGTAITRDSLNPNVRFIGGPTAEFFKVESPTPGLWQLVVNGISTDPGGESFEVFSRLKSFLKGQISLEKSSYAVGERFTVTANLSDGLPIRGATVFAIVTPPPGLAGTPQRQQLFDDGLHGDGSANDGVYGGSFLAGVAGAGSYLVQIEAMGNSNTPAVGTTADTFEFVRAPSQTILVTGEGRADNVLPVVTDFRREGFHRQPTRLVITFSEEINTQSAIDARNYSLIHPGRDGRFGTKDDRSIGLASVVYDAATSTVTITPKRRLLLHTHHQIIINGSGISDANGNLLDGDRDGLPGGSYARVFRRFRATNGRVGLVGRTQQTLKFKGLGPMRWNSPSVKVSPIQSLGLRPFFTNQGS